MGSSHTLVHDDVDDPLLLAFIQAVVGVSDELITTEATLNTRVGRDLESVAAFGDLIDNDVVVDDRVVTDPTTALAIADSCSVASVLWHFHGNSLPLSNAKEVIIHVLVAEHELLGASSGHCCASEGSGGDSELFHCILFFKFLFIICKNRVLYIGVLSEQR